MGEVRRRQTRFADRGPGPVRHPQFAFVFGPDHPFRLGTTEIAQMKEGAMVINLARGNFIDEQALFEAPPRGTLGRSRPGCLFR